MDWQAVSYVTSSKYRTTVMKELAERPKTPTQLSKPNTDIEMAHVSRTLKQLRENGLVELKVSEDTQKGRYHGLTEKGEEVWEFAKDEQAA